MHPPPKPPRVAVQQKRKIDNLVRSAIKFQYKDTGSSSLLWIVG
jgi:hypothetical protein